MLLAQLTLGVLTVLSGKNEFLASGHVAVGAALLGTAWLTTLRSHRWLCVASQHQESGVLTGTVATA